MYRGGVCCIEHAAKSAAKRHGVDIAQRLMLYAAQNGECVLCGEFEPDPMRLTVDHDHATGHIRGLLCNTHNVGLGRFGDDPVRLRQAANYLERSRIEFR